jgi:DNA (cytosine-5)-methyltransferase 1
VRALIFFPGRDRPSSIKINAVALFFRLMTARSRIPRSTSVWIFVFSYIDLFAGCGGLSLGLRRAGGSEIFAVEKSDGAARTFYANLISRERDSTSAYRSHLALNVVEQASAGLVVAPVADVLEVFEKLRLGDVDLVAGGPPCQGFSLAGRRNKNDARNKLVWEFLEFVEKVNPKFVIIENVVGMGRKFSADDEHSTFSDVQAALATTGQTYVVNAILVNAMHYGAPQHRPRLMVIGIRADVADVLGIDENGQFWTSDFADKVLAIPAFAPLPIRGSDRVLLGSAIRDLAFPPRPNDSAAYVSSLNDNAAWLLTRQSTKPSNHQLRKHRPATVYRFRFAQSLASIGISPRVMGPVTEERLSKEFDKIDLWFASRARPRLPVGNEIFANSEDFKARLRSLRNKKHSQRVLSWDAPAHTVVTIPDDFVHPDEPRTFSVRELARIQGFPDDFVFQGKVTTGGTDRRNSVPQYTQVGNAVSPLVGVALGEMVNELNSKYITAERVPSFATSVVA